MKYCPSCKVFINNDRKTCPLCYHVLENDDKELDFQKYPMYKHKRRLTLFTKIMLFISIIIILASVITNAVLIVNGIDYYWSIIVIAGIIYLWIILKYVFSNIGVITSKIMSTSLVTSLILLFIEIFLVKSKEYWFSIDIVIPCILVVTLFVVLLMMLIRKKLVIDSLFPLFGYTLISLMPLIIVLNMDMKSILWPSITCTSISAITLLYMLIFHTRDVAEEFKKRLHF